MAETGRLYPRSFVGERHRLQLKKSLLTRARERGGVYLQSPSITLPLAGEESRPTGPSLYLPLMKVLVAIVGHTALRKGSCPRIET